MMAKSWVVVYTEARRELIYAHHVIQRGIEAYVPITHNWIRHRRKQRTCITQPVFPQYVFTRSNLRAPGYRYTVRNKRGEPFYLDDTVVQELKTIEASGCFPDLDTDGYLFGPGDLAMVSFGVLEGWIGKVIRAARNHALLEIDGIRIHLGLDMLKQLP